MRVGLVTVPRVLREKLGDDSLVIVLVQSVK